MSECIPSTDSIILGCLASKFSPDNSVSFKWMDQSGKALTDVIQYPTVGTGEQRLKVSHITITKEKWDQSNITCTAEQRSEKFSKPFVKVTPQVPTLSLVLVPTPKSKYVVCVIDDFYPPKLTVQWKVNGNIIQSQTTLEYKLNSDGLYTVLSLYKVNSETLNANTEYTCLVTHRGTQKEVKKNFKSKFALMLKPPIAEDMFVKNKVILEAVVSGDLENTVKNTSVKCKVNSEHITDMTMGKVRFLNDTSQYIRIDNVTVDINKWFKSEKVTCTIHDTHNNRDITQEIHFNKGDGLEPKVTIYKPDISNTTHVSLVCEVSSVMLGNVYIMWKKGAHDRYIPGKTSGPLQQNDSTSVLSIFTVSKTDYENPQTTITCAVFHANMKNTSAPLQVTTSPMGLPEPEMGFALNCTENVLEEDELRSLWSTATSFIFLFLFSLTYSAVLSLFKMKQ